MAIDLTAARAEVARNRTVDGSAAALIRSITQRIQDAIAADDLQDSTALNELVADLQGSTDDLAAAVAENTPAEGGGGGEGGGTTEPTP